MNRLLAYTLVSFLLSSFSLVAAPAHLRMMVADTVDTAQKLYDDLQIPDSLSAALDSAFADTTLVTKERDKGFDATRFSMMKRFRPKNVPFISEKFLDNTFYSVHAKSFKLGSIDYSFGSMGGVSAGKWITPFHAVRANIDFGSWYDNFNGTRIYGGELTADYLFNLVAYLDGYRPDRLLEASVLAGLGYAGSGYKGKMGNAFTAHIGVNLFFRFLPGLELFFEPRVALYSNGMAISKGGNWRSWLAAFQGDFGVAYNISTGKYAKKNTYPWFVFTQTGMQFQNSAIVRNHLGTFRSLGWDISLGGGKYLTRYLAMRASLGYGHCKWVEYPGIGPKYTDYYSFRIEAMLDLISLISGKEDLFVSASVVLGPEIGFMYKDDVVNSFSRQYIGLGTGLQIKFCVWNGIKVFTEPRFILVPYSALNHTMDIINDYRNYYDGLVGINFGVEYEF